MHIKSFLETVLTVTSTHLIHQNVSQGHLHLWRSTQVLPLRTWSTCWQDSVARQCHSGTILQTQFRWLVKQLCIKIQLELLFLIYCYLKIRKGYHQFKKKTKIFSIFWLIFYSALSARNKLYGNISIWLNFYKIQHK